MSNDYVTITKNPDLDNIIEYTNAYILDHDRIRFNLIDYPDIVFDIKISSLNKLKLLYEGKSTMIGYYSVLNRNDDSPYRYSIIFRNNKNKLEGTFSRFDIGSFSSLYTLLDNGIELIPEVVNELFNKIMELCDTYYNTTSEDLS